MAENLMTICLIVAAMAMLGLCGCTPSPADHQHDSDSDSNKELTQEEREDLLADMFFSNKFLVDHFMLGPYEFKHDKPIDSVSAAENAFAGYYEWLKKNRTIEHDGISKVRTHGDFYYSIIKGSDGIIYAPMGRDCVYVGTPFAF